MKTLLQAAKVGKSYGSRVLLRDVTISFEEKQKIGVIGRNGAGKTTLFRILTETEEADTGDIIRASDLRAAWLEQKDPYQAGETVLEFLERYTGKPDWQCGKIAGRFQLKHELLNTPVLDLPGGYQMRVKLTAMLLGEPNFLMLDEPTNYLDLDTLILLENFLRDFNGGFLIISHDREFLMNTCSHTLEIEEGEAFLFPGNLEEYLEFKEQDRETKVRRNRNLEARRKELTAFVERFRAKATKARQAQSRVKQLEKLETIEIGKGPQNVRIVIPQVEARKGTAMRVSDLVIGYAEKTVARDITFDIERGARIAVLGDNGAGKTTLLRTIIGAIPALDGEIKPHAGAHIAYYAQNVYASLNPQTNIEDYLVQEAARDVSRQEVLNMAGSFLFQGDDVKKKISVLSGGERARMVLAGILLSRANVLLLDEPTNHLDFETVEALGAALRDYRGTIFFVSHDRTFVNLTATRILDVRDGSAEMYPGTYEEYVFSRRLRAEEGDPTAINGRGGSGGPHSTKTGEPAPDASEAETPRVNRHALKKEKQSSLKKKEKALRELEQEMAARDQEKERLTNQLAEGEYSRENSDRLAQVTTEAEEAEQRWLELQEEIEALQDDLRELGVV